MRLLTALLTLLIMTQSAAAQRYGVSDTIGVITGRVFDAESRHPIEFANIILYASPDSGQVDGDATDRKGKFVITNVGPGEYYIEVSFLGYKAKTIDDIKLKRGSNALHIGDVLLDAYAIDLESVDVAFEKPNVIYRIDRKVIDVSSDLTAVSGSAVDVLRNAPSVKVDADGNVSMRSSGSITVLVDGRPTLLDASDALQQIPAATIKDIEIITNPSAKYDPEGVGGIINVETRKNRIRGISGVIDAKGGTFDQYGGDGLVNFRNDVYSLSLSLDYDKRNRPGNVTNRNITLGDDMTFHVESTGSRAWGRDRQGARANLALFLSPKDVIGLGLRYGTGEMRHDSELDFVEWTRPGGNVTSYTSYNPTIRQMEFSALNVGLFHKFDPKEHKLSLQATYGLRDGDETSLSELYDESGNITEGIRTTEKGPGARGDLDLDYTRPLGESAKLEAGYQGTLRTSEDNTELFEYDTSSAEYLLKQRFSNRTDYDRYTHALYALFSNELDRHGFQVGLRTEYTDRVVETYNTSRRFTIDRWDWFPSLHYSFQFTKSDQLIASYSRRIDRPRGWFLEPFRTWMDAYNVREGNPDLQPEYIDSYEFGYRREIGRNALTSDVFYRFTRNKIEWIQSALSEDLTLHAFDNVGVDHALGAEFIWDWSLNKWWNARAATELYRYEVIGEEDGADIARNSINWSLKLNNDFRISRTLQVQFNGEYEGPQVEFQEEEEGKFSADLAVRYDIIPKVASATLQLRDVFHTDNDEETTRGRGFTNYRYREPLAPQVQLSMTYIFNDYKAKRRRFGGAGNMDPGEEF